GVKRRRECCTPPGQARRLAAECDLPLSPTSRSTRRPRGPLPKLPERDAGADAAPLAHTHPLDIAALAGENRENSRAFCLRRVPSAYVTQPCQFSASCETCCHGLNGSARAQCGCAASHSRTAWRPQSATLWSRCRTWVVRRSRTLWTPPCAT